MIKFIKWNFRNRYCHLRKSRADTCGDCGRKGLKDYETTHKTNTGHRDFPPAPCWSLPGTAPRSDDAPKRDQSGLRAKVLFGKGDQEIYPPAVRTRTAYINTISRYMERRGFTVRVYNDLFRKKNIKQFNPNLEIAYWSYDGDTENKRVSKANRTYRPGAADLQKSGFRQLNYNSHYLYFVPSRKNCTGENRRYMVRDLKKNWDLCVWDSDRGRKLSSKDGVIGSAISVWGEGFRRSVRRKDLPPSCAALPGNDAEAIGSSRSREDAGEISDTDVRDI